MSVTELAERLWAKVDKSGDCWVWQGSRTPQGYGHLWWNGRETYAHRCSWELTNGPIPKGLWILHHCDNPPCCNPAHLYAGTATDNARDRDQRGRNGVRKTHCYRGHDLSRTRQGRNGCTECRNLLQRERRAARRKAA